MTKIVYATILLLFSYYYSYAQEQTPAIEWVESYNGGNRGGSITPFPGPNVLFALIKGQNSISGTASISKFYADGLVKNQFIFADGGSSNAPAMSQYASQDGGVIVYLFLSRTLRKYDAALNLSWQKTVDYSIQNATATLANGFYLLTTTFVNNNNVSEIKRIKNDGSVEWSIDISGLSNILTDIQTTSDDGVIMATSGGLRKYSATGQLAWSNTSILNASQLVITDPSIMYVYTYNSTVIQLNTSTGNANWTKSITGENIVDFERTSDNGCVFSTNKGLYKYNSTGDLQWKNTDYSSAKITTTGDGKIFIIKNNTITKLTFNNEQLWAKSFNSDYYIIQDVNGASDFGLYVTAVKNGIYFNNNPAFLLFKLASPNTPCKTNFDIVGEPATFCKTGNSTFSSKISNVSMEYLNYLTNSNFQWYKDNVLIEVANSYAYTADRTGNYSLKIKQQGCEATSRSIELNIVNENAPIIESDKAIVCTGTSATLKANGCDGTVVWSTGARGQQIDVTPQATTTYNALCEKMVNNELCQSMTSNVITVFVQASSNLKIKDIGGRREFCENSSTQLIPTITGGMPPFTYIWQKNGTNNSEEQNISINEEGNYVFYIFDKTGCYDISEPIHVSKIANPAAPILNTPASTVLCNGQSIVLSAEPQESNYQWLLNNAEIRGAMSQSYTATSPGTYQVKIFNKYKCSTISDNSIVVTTSDLKINDITGKKAFCENASTNLTASIIGGKAPFLYKWTKEAKSFSQNEYITIKEEGSYILSVTDNIGCSILSDTIKIKKLATPGVPVITNPISTEICNNSNIVLTTETRENAYQWLINDKEIEGAKNQFYSATAPGKYQVKITNADNCSSISENAIILTQLIIPQPTIKQSNDSLISSASAGNKWYFNTTELPLTSQKIKFTEVGNYQVKVFEKGCESIISANFIPIILANEETSIHIQLYPNPTSDKVFIKSSKAFSYQLVDVMGRAIKQSTDKSFSHTIDVKGFTSGNYFVILQEENGNNFVRKLSVNQ